MLEITEELREKAGQLATRLLDSKGYNYRDVLDAAEFLLVLATEPEQEFDDRLCKTQGEKK